MKHRPIWPFVFALLAGACSGGEDGGASTGADGLSAELMNSAEQLAQDPRSQMSTAGIDQNAIGAFLDEFLPNEQVDLDTLGFDLGDPEAPIQILEFSDFGCGYCRQFHLETFPTLIEEYVDAGKVKWKYVPMLLGIFPNAVEAAQVGECVGKQGLFLEVSDALFQRQSDWKGAGGDPMPVLMEIVEEAGGDRAAAEACVAENRHASRVASGTAFFANSGGRGTPTFFVTGFQQPIPGAVPLDLFRTVLDTVWASYSRAVEAGTIPPAGN